MARPWKKAPEELTRRFRAALPTHPDVQPRQMFGYAAAFVRGNFWTGLFEDRVVIRLPDGLHQEFPELKDAPPFDPMGGRPMRGWFVVPGALSQDDAALAGFLVATLPAVLALPPKAGAARKSSPRKTAIKNSAPKKAAPKKAAPKKAAPKKAAPKKAAPKKAAPRKAAPRKGQASKAPGAARAPDKAASAKARAPTRKRR